MSEVGEKKSSRSGLRVKYIYKRPFHHKRANVWRREMLRNAVLNFFHSWWAPNQEKREIGASACGWWLPWAQGQPANEEQMPSFKKLLMILPRKPCNIPSPDYWSGLLWANNRAAQEVGASEVKAWKENWKSCPHRCFFNDSSSVSYPNANSVPGDGDTVRAAGMQQLRQSGLRQLDPAAEPWEQASPAR